MNSLPNYSEVFSTYRDTMATWAIYESVPSVYRRTRIYLGCGLIIIVEILLMSFYQYDIWPACLTVVSCLIYLPLIRAIMYYNRKDLLKFYSHMYEFSKMEKKYIGYLLDRIKNEKFDAYLGENKENVAYLRNLIENSKEKTMETKKDFKIHELGLATILAIVLNSFFSTTYDQWKSYHSFDLVFQRTVFILAMIVVLYIIYWTIKDFIMDLRNSDYNAHKKLYDMLKDHETKAMFKN